MQGVQNNSINESGASNRHHFHTFDALRFFAFFKVFLLHLPIVAWPWFNTIRAGGGIGVMFFFVLSGFLITYIVAEEKNRSGTFNLKKFYVRRILRIWPLYYLMVLVAYATPYLLANVIHIPSSNEGYTPNLWVSMLFLENYMMMVTHTHANVSPLSVMWSLCIEEHFYLLWGLLLYFLSIKSMTRLLYVFIILGVIFRYVYVAYDIPTSDLFTNIDLFAFGALPACWLVTNKNGVETHVNSVQYGIKMVFAGITIVAVLLCSQHKTDADYIWSTTLLGALFCGMILIIIPEKNRFKIKDTNWLSRLGLYTYGLYMYHILVINLLKQVFRSRQWNLDIPLIAVVFFVLSLAVTVMCSMLSYYLFEKQFLKLKKYFR